MEVSKQVAVSVVSIPYESPEKKSVHRVIISNDSMRIEVTNLGCAITGIYTADRNGVQKNIVAGFRDMMEYEHNDHYLGCVVGRYANRIAGGRFSLNGQVYQLTRNDGENHLHGGVNGFNKKVWSMGSLIRLQQEAGVEFEYFSKDGEEGYPGNLRVKVRYVLNDRNQLRIQYIATTDKSTPVSLTNHSYFNLTGFEVPDVLNHLLCIHARQYTPKGISNTPTGKIGYVNEALDFTQSKLIGRDIDQFPTDKGYDQNYVLEKRSNGKLSLAAELSELKTGRWVKVFTDQPALQLYTANLWDGSVIGSQGVAYEQYGAVALETQGFPDGPNQKAFSSGVLNAGEEYERETVYEFGVRNTDWTDETD